MTNFLIADKTEKTTATGTEVVLIQDGTTYNSMKISTIKDYIDGEWQDWTPTVTCSPGTLTVNTPNCRYIVVGKVIFLKIYIDYSVTSGTPTDIYITLPTGTDINIATNSFVSNGDYFTIATDHTSTLVLKAPTSSIRFRAATSFDTGVVQMNGSYELL